MTNRKSAFLILIAASMSSPVSAQLFGKNKPWHAFYKFEIGSEFDVTKKCVLDNLYNVSLDGRNLFNRSEEVTYADKKNGRRETVALKLNPTRFSSSTSSIEFEQRTNAVAVKIFGDALFLTYDGLPSIKAYETCVLGGKIGAAEFSKGIVAALAKDIVLTVASDKTPFDVIRCITLIGSRTGRAHQITVGNDRSIFYSGYIPPTFDRTAYPMGFSFHVRPVEGGSRIEARSKNFSNAAPKEAIEASLLGRLAKACATGNAPPSLGDLGY